jgi:hypothetical protein
MLGTGRRRPSVQFACTGANLSKCVVPQRSTGKEPTGIVNFGWVDQGRVARGEQPREDWGGYGELREAGVTCLLCLREATERENLVAGRPFPTYRVEEEEEQCRALGMRLRHVPFQDRAIPPVAGLVAALEAIEQEVAAGQVVYIHCMAGIGRTGLVAAFWRLAQGASGNEVADEFIAYWREFGEREDAIIGPLPDTILDRYGFPLQWWALHRVAEMVGSPVTEQHEGARQERPEDAQQWLEEASQHLVPWIRARRGRNGGSAGGQ